MNIWVNGCFDILHSGHIDLLQFAKSYTPSGEVGPIDNMLIVGIDSDKRVKELKGNNRPINNENERKRILKAIKFVDDVVIYDNEQEMCKLILKYSIDYMIIGEDYKNKRVLCREHSKHDVIFFSKDDRSSTNIINKIKKL
jgi:D-beta-D-heptose 7-phosphate kinase/D-beta-D-heptose 1-phosphate adenosyltransferase